MGEEGASASVVHAMTQQLPKMPQGAWLVGRGVVVGGEERRGEERRGEERRGRERRGEERWWGRKWGEEWTGSGSKREEEARLRAHALRLGS